MNLTSSRRLDKLARIGTLTVLVGGILLATVSTARAQTAPAAGTSIGNRASATYTDGAGVSRETQSNQVTTTVQQVPAVALTADRSLLRNPGAPVYFPHTVQNTGNGPDRFNLTTGTATGNIAGAPNTVIYLDLNRDGVPDSQAPVAQTPTLAPGETFSFVVGDVVSTGAVAGSTGTVSVTATSVSATAPFATNNDTVTATAGAVVALRKSVSSAGGAPGSSGYTYSLRYTNSGTTASGPITVTDTLPAGVTYAPGSGTFNRAPGDALTDTDDGFEQPGPGTAATSTSPNDINYAVTGNTVTFVVPNVPAGGEGLVTFNFSVPATTPPGIVRNTASLAYKTDNNPNTPTTNDSSNTVDFSVSRNTTLTYTGQTLADAVPQGGTAVFRNTLTNTGTGTDSFNITVANTSFPPGTSFQLFKPDGQSPLLDTNGDGIPDTGPLATGAQYIVVVKAILPPGATSATSLSATSTATSIATPGVTATATDTAPSIAGAAVNLDNNPADSEILANTAVVTASGAPGTSVPIPLRVTNNGGRVDSYVLSVSNTAGTQGQPGTGTPLPAGYSVVFRDPDTGVVSSNISNVKPNVPAQNGNPAVDNSRLVQAIVTIPAGAAAGTTTDLFFTAFSPTTNSANTIRDAVTVNQVRSISVQPNQSGQVFPGSTVSYVNVVKNTGNVTETDIAIATSGDANGFTSVVYLDANNNGTLDTGETTPVTSIASLAAGISQNLIVRVFGPNSTGQVGQTNVTQVRATLDADLTLAGFQAGGAFSSANDTTTLVVGDVTLVKTQAVAARTSAAGVNPATYGAFGTFSQSPQNANPGDRVRYSISVTNTGATPVNAVTVFDSLPAYTTFVAGSATGGGATSTTVPNANNSLTFNIGTLQPGASTTVTFDVQIAG